MKVYLSHASRFDYAKDLYAPIKKSVLFLSHIFILPHDAAVTSQNSKEIIAQSDVIIAETSYPSTGQGIELGWANAFSKPIFCICKKGICGSSSLISVCTSSAEYETEKELMHEIVTFLDSL
ncbi:MAG: hypothetical protein Q8R40_07045 [bacterium]|nr:hypothetical protein [bacterium]